MTAIWRRELQAYFFTPVGYVYMGVFIALSSILFHLQILQQRSSDILTLISLMSYLWMLLCPVLTMRLMAEDRQKRTDQLLLTSPVSLAGLVGGKYLAAVTVLLATVLATTVYALVIAAYGALWPGEAATGYLGFVLQGCAFVAVDLLVSTLCRGPVTAAVAALGVNFSLWMMDLVADTAPGWLSGVLSFLSLYSRNEPFLMGQLSFASVLYDLTVIGASLALAIHVLDRRRWR
ncbi:MAG: ABC transporter permease subunit [Clostridia bacterium]|nr:ABC transporter permease subunit [Clostridia bacterium]